MIDNEMFKLVVNGGSFAMIVLFFVWLLFKAEPAYRATVIQINLAHQATVEALTRTFESSLANQQKSFETMIGNMQRDFREALEAQEKQCRAERKEWAEMIRSEGELNRNSRHELVNKMTTLYAQGYNRDKDKTRPPEGQ